MHKRLSITSKFGIAIGFVLLVLVGVATRANFTLAHLSGFVSPAAGGDIATQEFQLNADMLATTGELNGVSFTSSGLELEAGAASGSVTSAPVNSPLGYTTDIVPLWETDLPDNTGMIVETRLSSDNGQTWSGWLENPEAFFPVRGEMHSGNLIWTGSENVTLQLRVTLSRNANGDTPTLRQLVLVFNDTSAGPSDADIAGQRIGVASTDNDSCSLEKPAIVSRTDWGSPDGQDSPRRPPQYAPVTHVVVHQTETPNNTAPYQDYAGWVRSVWNFHANVLGWGDVGYNYMVDPNGVIYEGRAGGDNVIGIHDTHNAGSMGLGLLGCYGNCDDPRLSVAEPSEAMLDSVASLMAWKLGSQGIDPLSSADYSYLSDIPVIAGGRDVIGTSAPGDNVYNQLPDLRLRVADKINCTETTPTPTVIPTDTPTTQPQACQITGVIFDKESYLPGDMINFTVRLADYAGVPLVGASVSADVSFEALPSQQSSTGFGLVDRAGEYEGSYTQTSLPGYYTFNFTASDPTGQQFQTCSSVSAVLVADAGYVTPTAIPTEITETPTPTTTVPVETPTVTTTVPAETPTPTNTPETPEPTATPTSTPETPEPTATPTEEPTPTPTATDTPVEGTAVKVDPTGQSINVCTGSTSVTVAVQQVESMAAIQLELVYDPAVVQVVDADPNRDGVQITVDPVFSGGFIAQNEVDTVNGRVSFAATLLGSAQINGDTGLIQVDFSPQAPGTSSLTLEDVILASNSGQVIDRQLVGGTITVLQDCVSGTTAMLQLEGRSDHSGIVVTNESGQQTTTAFDGSFSIEGSGPFSFEHPGFLSTQSSLATAVQGNGFGQAIPEVITLLAGDTSGDGQINILDLAYIAQQYGTIDGLADLNGDGLVDILDIVLAGGNFGQANATSSGQ